MGQGSPRSLCRGIRSRSSMEMDRPYATNEGSERASHSTTGGSSEPMFFVPISLRPQPNIHAQVYTHNHDVRACLHRHFCGRVGAFASTWHCCLPSQSIKPLTVQHSLEISAEPPQ